MGQGASVPGVQLHHRRLEGVLVAPLLISVVVRGQGSGPSFFVGPVARFLLGVSVLGGHNATGSHLAL